MSSSVAGIEKSDDELIFAMFNGLPSRYTNLIESLESTAAVAPLTLLGVQARLRTSEQREKMLSGGSSSKAAYGEDTQAMWGVAGGGGHGRGAGGAGGRGGGRNAGSGVRIPNSGPKPPNAPRPPLRCWKCNAEGHKEVDCPRGQSSAGPSGGQRPGAWRTPTAKSLPSGGSNERRCGRLRCTSARC